MASTIGQELEDSFSTLPDTLLWNQGKVDPVVLTTSEKVQHYVGNALKAIACTALMPLAFVYSGAKWIGTQTVSFLSPKINQEKPIEWKFDPSVLPPHVGFSASQFQDEGLGCPDVCPTKRANGEPFSGICDWNKALNPQHIEGTDANTDYKQFFVSVLSNPQPFIAMLKEMGVTAHRFSLEWAFVTDAEGNYDLEAIELYRKFIVALKEAGIEPYVTLHHFVSPEWFAQKGGWDRLENVELYTQHALHMINLFPEVKNWIPFNEINVYGFQTAVRGDYPPWKEGDMQSAGRMMRNMLIAHCKLYQAAKTQWPERDLQIGSTHQWLEFEPLVGNPLEKIICHFLNKITHWPCYNFWKTGQFSMKMPGKANIQFSIPEEEFKKHNGFSDFTGVQFYGFPRIKAGFNGGENYPGYGTKNWTFGPFGLSFGTSCPKEGATQSFGPSVYPESLRKCLAEAKALGKPIAITETGCDAEIQKHGDPAFKLDNETQKQYFEAILPILAEYQDSMKALLVWTAFRKNLEWNRGGIPTLGLIDIQRLNGKIAGYTLSPAAELLKEIYSRKREELAALVPAA